MATFDWLCHLPLNLLLCNLYQTFLGTVLSLKTSHQNSIKFYCFHRIFRPIDLIKEQFHFSKNTWQSLWRWFWLVVMILVGRGKDSYHSTTQRESMTYDSLEIVWLCSSPTQSSSAHVLPFVLWLSTSIIPNLTGKRYSIWGQTSRAMFCIRYQSPWARVTSLLHLTSYQMKEGKHICL